MQCLSLIQTSLFRVLDKMETYATDDRKTLNNLTSVTIQDLIPWRMSSIPGDRAEKLEKLAFYNFKDYVRTIDEAISFLRKHVDGIVAISPARLRQIFIDWTVLEVEFESIKDKQAALESAPLIWDNNGEKPVEKVSPLPSNGCYRLIRLKDLPLEDPKEAVARVQKSMPTFIDYWRREEYARPNTIDVVAEGKQVTDGQKPVYSGNISIIIEGGSFSKKSLRERHAYIDGYGKQNFEIAGIVFHEYCHVCKTLNGGHESRFCPQAMFK